MSTKTYEHKIKCMSCGLHFIAMSWQENWAPTGCPECGVRYNEGAVKDGMGGFMHWRSETDDFIFNRVPGESPMVGIGV
jgi:DNA-directed RNA polymerase subunit RPC12/RpoP